MSEIRDSLEQHEYYMFLNKERTPAFSYKNLKNLLYEIVTDCGTTFKLNLGFGFMSYHTMKDEFRYFYVLLNRLLFDKTFRIYRMEDIVDGILGL